VLNYSTHTILDGIKQGVLIICFGHSNRKLVLHFPACWGSQGHWLYARRHLETVGLEGYSFRYGLRINPMLLSEFVHKYSSHVVFSGKRRLRMVEHNLDIFGMIGSPIACLSSSPWIVNVWGVHPLGTCVDLGWSWCRCLNSVEILSHSCREGSLWTTVERGCWMGELGSGGSSSPLTWLTSSSWSTWLRI
jgi:hypothetical protein